MWASGLVGKERLLPDCTCRNAEPLDTAPRHSWLFALASAHVDYATVLHLDTMFDHVQEVYIWHCSKVCRCVAMVRGVVVVSFLGFSLEIQVMVQGLYHLAGECGEGV